MSEQQSKEDKTLGRWTKTEHQNFLLGLQLYGKNWKKIQQLIGTRTGSQIRSHAQKFFLKFKKDGNSEENEKVESEVSLKQEPLTVILRQENSDENKNSNQSFFMTIITKMVDEPQKLNFWDQFIDQKLPKTESQQIPICMRKNSFTSMEGFYDSRQQSPISFYINNSQLNH